MNIKETGKNRILLTEENNAALKEDWVHDLLAQTMGVPGVEESVHGGGTDSIHTPF